MPKDDTAARRGPSVCGHGTDVVGMKNRVPDGSIAGFHSVKFKLGESGMPQGQHPL